MKKILIILIALSLLSCDKEECYTCTTIMTTTVNMDLPGYPQTIKTTTVKCGTEEDISNYEKEGTASTTVTVQGISAISRARTNCVLD